MNLSPLGLALLQRFEGLRLDAYLDVAGIPTIGYGTIRYPDGRKVQLGDTCTPDQADAYLRHDVQETVLAVDALTRDDVTQAQFDALVSFAYNLGKRAYQDSTLRRKVNAHPHDPKIRAEFMKWVYAGGRRVKGLHLRRHEEADHYFGTHTPPPPFK